MNYKNDASFAASATLSGIIFDQYTSSAIINFYGTDYMVRGGDIVGRFKVLYIGRDFVLLQCGKNIFKAQVGSLFTPTKDNINWNYIGNVNKSFGGNAEKAKLKFTFEKQ